MSGDLDKQPRDRPVEFEPESPDRPATRPEHQHLRAAIKKTVEIAAQGDGGEPSRDSVLQVVIQVASRHRDVAALNDLQIASELVFELGKYALPAQVFHASIGRVCPEIAAALLEDPIAAPHLAKAWALARHAAGLD
jgi:hypothetical protein